ncbi:MAG TPA: hypothetical protein ENO23_05015, partial [Alphaproteobacteria bacterium]|nr:hypothetical protein [Alphaproteobacteria bacterium]
MPRLGRCVVLVIVLAVILKILGVLPPGRNESPAEKIPTAAELEARLPEEIAGWKRGDTSVFFGPEIYDHMDGAG